MHDSFDLVVRGGLVVNADGRREADIAVSGDTIAEIGQGLHPGVREIDARGLVVLPALVDAHVHFNEPGRTDWEGAATGSRALAAGGGSCFCDMPLNSTPCTVTAAAVDAKRAALEATSIADFGLWGGLVPGHVGDLAAMADRGVVGFKAFMCASGLDEFPRADDRTLYDGLREASRLGLPVAVHAENDALVGSPAGRDARAFLASRPALAEAEAIQRATLLAEDAGATLHIVHVSTGRGVAVAAEARARGVDVSIETCPHYLFFTEEDVERLGVIVKCAPPLRTPADREALWMALVRGEIDLVASDHSPAPPSMKTGDFVSAWGGIAGVQSTLAVLLDRGYHGRQISLERLVDLTSRAPARRFRLGGKGVLRAGFDADMVLVETMTPCALGEADLEQRHRSSPYVGTAFRGRVRYTIRRGTTLYDEGRVVAERGGRFIRPRREHSDA